MARDIKVDRGRRRVGLRSGVFATVIVLVCVVVAIPVSAFVSRSVHTVVVQSSWWTVNDKSASASCPSGEHVQFGGFASGNGAAVRGMRRSADDQWTVDGSMFPTGKTTSSVTGRVTSIAYCAPGPVPLKVTHSVRVGDVGSATATCPAGTVVLAGGFATSPQSDVVIHKLERIGADGWRVRIGRITGRAHTILTSVAYCGMGPAPKLVSSRVPLSQRSEGTTDAVCPAGTSLMFGGAIVSGGGYVSTMKVRARTRNTLRVVGYLYPGINGSLTALAYCR